MGEKQLNKCSLSLPIKRMQIRTTLRFHLIPVKTAQINKKMTTYAGEDVS